MWLNLYIYIYLKLELRNQFNIKMWLNLYICIYLKLELRNPIRSSILHHVLIFLFFMPSKLLLQNPKSLYQKIYKFYAKLKEFIFKTI